MEHDRTSRKMFIEEVGQGANPQLIPLKNGSADEILEKQDKVVAQPTRYSLRERKQNISYNKFKEDFIVNEDELDQEFEERARKKRRKKHRRNSDDDSDFDTGKLKAKKLSKSKKRAKITLLTQQPNPQELLMPWKKHIEADQKAQMDLPTDSYKLIHVDKVVNENLAKYGPGFEAVLLNPPWNYSDPAYPIFTFDDFAALKFPKKLIVDGLLFVWVEKECMRQVISKMEQLRFQYVENLAWIKLDPNKENDQSAVKVTPEGLLDVKEMYWRGDYAGFAKSKSILLIFRKRSANGKLQLRHQRTCDVVFDFYRKDLDYNYKPIFFVYNMIETLLPKAGYDPESTKKRFKMLELWGSNEPRKGWIKLTEKSVDENLEEKEELKQVEEVSEEAGEEPEAAPLEEPESFSEENISEGSDLN